MFGGLMQLVAYGAEDVFFDNVRPVRPLPLFGRRTFIINTYTAARSSTVFAEESDESDEPPEEPDEPEEPPTYRLISADADRNQDCPITLCPIETGEKYCICPTCQHNFSAAAIATIAENTDEEEAMPCPLCRANWTKEDTRRFYINSAFSA
jgi:hypothetical protein